MLDTFLRIGSIVAFVALMGWLAYRVIAARKDQDSGWFDSD